MKQPACFRLSLAFLIALITHGLTCFTPTRGAEAQTDKADGPRLPGAQPVVKAIDYPSLQEALDAVPPEGGKVKLPPGTFEISKPLVIHQEHIHITGAGSSTHIKNTNTQGKPTFLIEPAARSDGKTPEPQWRVQMTQFRLSGNDQSGAGIVAVRVNELLLDRLTITEHGKDGLLLDHCYENPRITNCMITYNNGAGLDLQGCHDIVVNGNHFEENQDAVRCVNSFNLCMSGNNLDDHLRHGVVIENTYGSVVSGNMIEECQGTAVVLDRDCYGDTISANVIAHNGHGVDLRDAHGCTVSANTFTIMKRNALRVGPESGRITVVGNNFSDSYIGEGKLKRDEGDRAAAGITLEGTKQLNITGNTFAGLKPEALELKGPPSQNILFSDNTLIETKSDHEGLTNSITKQILQVPAPKNERPTK